MIKKLKKKFLRRNTGDYSRLGRGRKKLQKWRKPKGIDNKMRLKERGRPSVVSVGYKQPASERNKLNGKEIVRVESVSDLKKVGKGQIGILAKVGKKKKMEIAKEIEKEKVEMTNFDFKKFLKEEKNETKS